ncbi:MAG: hypothetical protein II881_06045 [Oscillospiraceae bacterium]|nr:hypothetical protein [Oscillospiraceae bacterium]
MKKEIISLTIAAALVLGGCANAPISESEKPADEPITSEDVQQTPSENTQTSAANDEQTASETPSEPATEPGRKDGERFEAVIIMEGMEETVQYEHIRNEAIGIEMDYDYELFVRQSKPHRERFISDWDDPENPENYLEVTYNSKDADTAAASISEELSKEYELITENFTLEGAGECIRIGASEVKGGGYMPDMLQMVYVIPASDGCRIAWAHYAIEGAEGFGRRFAYMVNTLSVIDRIGTSELTDEQAVAAIQKYCYSTNPELEDKVKAEEYPIYWDVSSSDEQEIVVVYRSYTGSINRYYIDRSTGETYVTEFVPGIMEKEQRTDETLNVWDYVD